LTCAVVFFFVKKKLFREKKGHIFWMKIASKETDTQRENGGPHTFDEYGPPWFGAEKKTNKNQQKIGEKTGENGAGGG